MIKKLFVVVLWFFVVIAAGSSCNNKDNETISVISIPQKENEYDNNPIKSPVNTKNLDEYMFREDVQYVDLRSIEMIVSEGYIAGFEMVPFYSIIASFSPNSTLYRIQATYDENNQYIPAGRIGGFVPQYQESKDIIESIFSKEKYIFLISQGGTESGYLINLLIQLGYNPNLLYNIGGVMNNEGIPAYSSIETNKYFVAGHGDMNFTFDYDFMNDLTPIV